LREGFLNADVAKVTQRARRGRGRRDYEREDPKDAKKRVEDSVFRKQDLV